MEGGGSFLHTVSDLSAVVQLVGELVDKWSSFPESQHTPLCAHLLGLAMKTVSQLALGETFCQDAQVVSFRKNHDAVSQEPAEISVELLDSEGFCCCCWSTCRSGRRSGRASWTAPWRRASAGRDSTRKVRSEEVRRVRR